MELGRMLLNIGFRAVSGYLPVEPVARLTIEELGPAFCQAAWEKLSQWSRRDQREALEQIARIDTGEAKALAEASLEPRGDLSPQLRAQAVQYLASIPMSTRRTLVPDGQAASGMSLPSAGLPVKSNDLLRFLPLRPPRFKPGQGLAGHDWQLDRLIGQGGFGEVWLATNPRRPRQQARALKFCLDESMLRSLERETELLDRIEESREHPGIVRLLETALSAEPPFLAYEYVNGGDLTHWLAVRASAVPADSAAKARPTPGQVAAVLLQMADALGFAHGLGLVHCDLKPSNVLMEQSGVVKLADFGIGRLVAVAQQKDEGWRTATTLAQSMLQGACTPMYADRALRRGESVDARADIYSVGVMAYQLLLGDIGIELSPYFAEELEAAGVPASLIAVVSGCLTLPERRYANGAALLAALEPVARELGVFDVVPSNPESGPQSKSVPEETTQTIAEAGAQSQPRSVDPAPLAKPATGGHPDRTPVAPLILRTKRRTYTVGKLLGSGPLADVFQATVQDRGAESAVHLKIARHAGDNDFLENEARVLRHLRADARSEGLRAYFPELRDAFRVQDPGGAQSLQANALSPVQGLHTVEQVIQAYPAGIDPRDLAWMWKRMLGLTGVAHACGVVQGGLIPPLIGLDLQEHSPYFPDWSFAMLLRNPQPLQAIVPGYEAYYPPEVFRKEPISPATDVFMIARCVVRLLGGNPKTGELPASVPASLQRLLTASTLPEAGRRLDDCWQLHQELDVQLERLYGPRKFRKFVLP